MAVRPLVGDEAQCVKLGHGSQLGNTGVLLEFGLCELLCWFNWQGFGERLNAGEVVEEGVKAHGVDCTCHSASGVVPL